MRLDEGGFGMVRMDDVVLDEGEEGLQLGEGV